MSNVNLCIRMRGPMHSHAKPHICECIFLATFEQETGACKPQ